MNEFSEILKSIRQDLGFSQKDFAQQIGMKPAAYNMIESGKNQPSYALLNTVISIFKVDANRLFSTSKNEGVELKLETKFVFNNDVAFLNTVHRYIKNIDYLYQRLVDVRVLLQQELRIDVQLSTEAEMELLNTLTRPQVKDANNGSSLQYPYENLTKEGKVDYLKKLEDCVDFFTNTFFEGFKQLYRGIRIPATEELHKHFLEERKKLTDNFKYTNYLKG